MEKIKNLKMKDLQRLKEKIEKMYLSIPCCNCLVRPTCFNLSDDDLALLTVRPKCGEFFAWLEKTKIKDFWATYYKNPFIRDIRKEILNKLL